MRFAWLKIELEELLADEGACDLAILERLQCGQTMLSRALGLEIIELLPKLIFILSEEDSRDTNVVLDVGNFGEGTGTRGSVVTMGTVCSQVMQPNRDGLS